MKKILWLVLLLLLAVPIWGQVPVPYTFVPGTTASATQVNANFDALARNALNLSGGKITGDIIVDPGRTVDGVDISAVLGNNGIKTGSGLFVRPEAPQLAYGWDDPAHLGVIYVNAVGDGFFDLTTAGASYHFGKPIITDALTVTTLTCTGCIKATQLDNLLGAKAGIYGDAVTVARINVDTDGRIIDIVNSPIAFPAPPVVPPSYALGPNQIPETAIIDGALLARVGAAETITGAWTFSTAPAFNGGLVLNFPADIRLYAAGEGGVLKQSSACPSFPGLWLGSRENGADHLVLCLQDGLLTTYGQTKPSEDDRWTLGDNVHRWKNINLALPNNTTPALVIVNKGGGGPDANTSLGYIQGYSPNGEQIKQMGACIVAIRGGIITSVTGC